MVLLSIPLNNLPCTQLLSLSLKSDNKMKVSEIDPDMKKSTKVLAPNAIGTKKERKKRREDLENADREIKEETKMGPKGDSLLEPILTTWGSVHKETFQCLWEPILTFNKVTFIYDVRCLGT